MIKLAENSVQQVPVTQITVSKANMRDFYDPEALEGLEYSMGKMGQIYPVVLHRIRPGQDKFELIIGSRRLKAARKAECKTIAATILEDISDPDMIILSLAENLHRSDLNPFEEARGYLELAEKYGMPLQQISRRVDRPVSHITGRLKILSVPDQVQDLLCKEKVTLNHVGILASLKKPKDQIRYAKVVAKEALSEEDLVTLIRDEASTKGQRPPVRAERPASDKLFTPMRTALKVKRFNSFLKRKVRPQLAMDGKEIAEVRKALREMSDTIDELLGRSRKLAKSAS